MAKVGCGILVQRLDRDDIVGKLRDPAYPDVEGRQGTRGGDGALARVARHTQLAGTPCRPWGQLGQRGARQGQGRSTEKERRQDRAHAPHFAERGGNNEASKRVFAHIRPLLFSTNTSLGCTACLHLCVPCPPPVGSPMDADRRTSESQTSHPPPRPDLFRSKGTPCALVELVERDLRDVNLTYPSVTARTGGVAVAEASTATAPRPRRVGSTSVSWPTNSAGLKLLAGSDSSPLPGPSAPAPATGSSVSLDGVTGALTLRFTPDVNTKQSSRTKRKT